jgi:streptogramin lyase
MPRLKKPIATIGQSRARPRDRGLATTRSISRLIGFHAPAVAVVALALLLTGISAAMDRPRQPSLLERQRFGFVATSANWHEDFDVAQLKAGWFVDASGPACGLAPEGMERAYLLRTRTGLDVDPDWLGPLVDRHPGILWLIGNEPDCIWQDNVEPEEYARIYHDFYSLIKNQDPTSQVSPGGIVQPTPLRLQWLDRVLAGYQERYSETMPVDVWNIHNAILNEVSCEHDPGNCWGAGIPPGINADVGIIREPQDNDDMGIFENQIWDFRQWMNDNGYSGYPLVVTEYGILMPDDYGFDADRVNAFMDATFQFFQEATHPELGDPTDDHRLVQRWAWFSLDVQPWNPITGRGFNGNLFDPESKAITAHGLNYAVHTASFPPLEYVDLSPGPFQVLPASTLAGSAQTITRQVQVEILNEGTLDSSGFRVALEYTGPATGTLEQEIDNLPPASSQWITYVLAELEAGKYTLYLSVNPDNEPVEATLCNNQATGMMLAPTARVLLPLVARQHDSAPWQSGVVKVQDPDALASAQHLADRSFRSPETQSPAVVHKAAASLESAARWGFREFEMPTADSSPVQLALDATRQVLWVTGRDGNRIVSFSPQTETWQEYEIPTIDSQPWGLAVDGEGNVWFAETATDKIGRLDVASGTVSEPVTLTDGSQPWGVAISSVGTSTTVWFTERLGNQIGKFVPATGVVTHVALPTPGAQPSGIDVRTDVQGTYVWFTETAANRLGRLRTTESQSVTEIPIPTSNSAPHDVVIAPGGNPWLTEGQGNKIALFSVGTVITFTEIPVFTVGSEPYGIAVEVDSGVARAVWFTERNGNRLGRFTGEHSFPSEYLLPTPNSRPTDIVVDGEGCAWYTAPDANRIGRFCPPPDTYIFLPLVLRDESPVQGR